MLKDDFVCSLDGGGYVEVLGARVNNLKNVDVRFPRNSLTVITGLSGSGKSSLAFDTIYAEGQRRYVETFSSYARGFLGCSARPDVDRITGLSPVISIEQKTTNKNPRSTVGTTTEIYDFLRVMYARCGQAYSYLSGERMVRYSEEQVADLIVKDFGGRRICLLAPVVRNRKGHYRELFDVIRRKGYLNVRVDGEVCEVVGGMKLDRYKNHSVDIVVDKFVVGRVDVKRLGDSVGVCMREGEGELVVLDVESCQVRHYSKHLMCSRTGLSYREPAPHNFSFNSPLGACGRCKGLGVVSVVDMDKVVPDRRLSVYQGAILPLGRYREQMIFWKIDALLSRYGVSLKTPVEDYPEGVLEEVMYGCVDRVAVKASYLHASSDYYVRYEGVVKFIESLCEMDDSASSRRWADQFSVSVVCPECGGRRLNREALHFFVGGKSIADLAAMDIERLYEWVVGVEDVLGGVCVSGCEGVGCLEDFDLVQRSVLPEIFKEVRPRLKFLLDVGLGYLSLDRPSSTLSGGESQRIRLATQIGSQLVNVLYILDEPSIGLHSRDNGRLIGSLRSLQGGGNTVVVVEHDEEMMRASDYIIDMGPRAGRLGGEVVFQGRLEDMLCRGTLTSDYLCGRRHIEIPVRRRGNGKFLKVLGACGNNLKGIDVVFPLGMFVCVTGVSGSGKSTLVNGTLQPLVSQHLHGSLRAPLGCSGVEGLEFVDKVVNVDQSPIGRVPRSNPATYTGVFNDIRLLFSGLPESKIRGYKPGRFSFNVKGGRCEACGGNGYRVVEMNFLPDVYVVCDVCHGKRYERETLEVRFKGKSIGDVLDMTVDVAVDFFKNQPVILNKIKTLQDVGLGYLKLGQSSTTLSGGESQRVKLAAELSRRDTGRTLYILDEPTTGLHFEDIRVLLSVLNRLTDRGNTVVVIEHNMDVIKCADYVIDMGPEGGRGGGEVVFAGTPEELAVCGKGYTSVYLHRALEAGGVRLGEV